jgi:hypothetical protein
MDRVVVFSLERLDLLVLCWQMSAYEHFAPVIACKVAASEDSLARTGYLWFFE